MLLNTIKSITFICSAIVDWAPFFPIMTCRRGLEYVDCLKATIFKKGCPKYIALVKNILMVWGSPLYCNFVHIYIEVCLVV